MNRPLCQFDVLADNGYRFEYVTTVEAATVSQARKLALKYFGGDYRSELPFRVRRQKRAAGTTDGEAL